MKSHRFVDELDIELQQKNPTYRNDMDASTPVRDVSTGIYFKRNSL
ncbi:hypothetical protein [Vibrio chagasii]|nr:hypothetical protein [Vibrio chagasii]